MKGRGSQLKTHAHPAARGRRGVIAIFSKRSGYTVVEVLIFLAVTGFLFAMILLTFSGRQGRTQFTTSAREMESIVRDLINDVSIGYYPSSDNFNCVASATGPSITAVAAGTQKKGTNGDCVFIGRAIHFDLEGAGTDDKYNVYTLAGLRKDITGLEATNYDQAKPKVVQPVTERLRTPFGMIIRSMKLDSSGADLDGFAIFGKLGVYDSNQNLQPGALNVAFVPIYSSVVTGSATRGSTEVDMISTLNGIGQAYIGWLGNNPGKIIVCMDSQSSNQHAELTIGGSQNSQLTTDLAILEGFCT